MNYGSSYLESAIDNHIHNILKYISKEEFCNEFGISLEILLQVQSGLLVPDRSFIVKMAMTGFSAENFSRPENKAPEAIDKQPQKLKTISLTEYRDKYMETMRGKTTHNITAAFNRLIESFGELQISELTVEMLQRFYVSQRERAHAAANDYINRLSTAFNRAVDFGYLEENPFLKVKISRVPQRERATFSSEDMKKLLEAESNQVLRNFYLFAFDTGFRRGEILNIKWGAIDFRQGLVKSLNDKTFTNKSMKDRDCPMTRSLFSMLSEMYSKAEKDNQPPSPESYVFSKPDGTPYNEDYITKRFKKICSKAGISGNITLHCTRHTFATNLLASGSDIYTTMALLGHSRIDTTVKYLHTNLSKKREAIMNLG